MNSPEYLLGIHNFKGRTEDELDISRGDYIEVIEDDGAFNDTWYIGKNLRTFATGLFPKPFTTSVASLPPDVQQLADKQRLAENQEMGHNPESVSNINGSLPPDNRTLEETAKSNVPLANQAAVLGQRNDSISKENTAPSTQGGEDVKRNMLSKLSIQDPLSTTTDSNRTISEPYLASTGDNTVDSSKWERSQLSEIDKAISAMQDPRPPTSNLNVPPLVNSEHLGNSPQMANPQQQLPSRSPLQPAQPVPAISASTGIPHPSNVLQWTPQNVEAYFFSKGLTEDAPKFVNHRITGAILLELDRETLKEIDIVSFGPRFEIDKEIKQLRVIAGYQAPDSKSPQSPLSPQSLSNTMINSPMATASMHSLLNTPVGTQQSYFGFPDQPQAQMQNPYSSQNGYLYPQLASQQLPQQLQPQQQVQQQAQPHQHLQQTPQSYAQSPYTQIHPQPIINPSYMSNAGNSNASSMQQPSESYNSRALDTPQSNGQTSSKSMASNPQQSFEEEITGSLNSTFSMQHKNLALAAAQVAGRGHHRHSSSATSHYSIPGGNGHQRSRTADEFDNGLQPALAEPLSSGSITAKSGPSHQRNWSRTSALSEQRVKQQQQQQKDRHERKHSRSTSTDSKKQKRRSSVMSLLSSSPKKTESTNTSLLSSNKDKDESSKDGSTKESSTLKSMMRPGLTKQKTSAFQEGIQQVTAGQATATADKSGWLHKRGGSVAWSKRYFTLHGTRLSYFSNFKDSKERGLIDIVGHRVVSVKDSKELLISLSAVGTGAGRYCFKLVPPGPGYKKGVAFTAPKVHYFAAESEKEMEEWQSAFITATIERDESQPVLSSCKLPTMSLPKAQELMAERLKTKGDIGSLTK